MRMRMGATHTELLAHERATYMTPHPHAIARVHARALGSPHTAHRLADEDWAWEAVHGGEGQGEW